MKCKVLMVLLLVVSWGMVQAAGNAELDIRVVGDTINPDAADQTLDIWVANDAVSGGFQFPIELTSSDGVTWTWVTQTVGWGTGKYITSVTGSRIDPPATVFDLTAGILVLESGLPTKIGMGGGVMNSPGMAAGALEHILSVHIDTDVQDTMPHQLCVDVNAIIGPFSYSFIDYGGNEMSMTFLDANSDGVWCFPVKTPPGAVDGTNPNVPATYSLGQNFPNPFNPTTVIAYGMERKGKIDISIFNVLGQHVKTLVDGEAEAGVHQAVWDGTDQNGAAVASGVYFYKMTTEKYVETRKMALMR
jgi:hypothetical protein